LKDFDIAVLDPRQVRDHEPAGGASGFEVSKVEFSADGREQGDYAHYMLKEIFEQPRRSATRCAAGSSKEEATAKLGGLHMSAAELRNVDRIIITGCGTAAHAAMCGEYIIEALAHVPVEVEFASEFRYRNLPLPKRHARLLRQSKR
jgi:glucosamine--fructose-6-phosphate aminotransferase (isomerizing)